MLAGMRRIQVLMDEELDDRLEREARRRHVSKSALLREYVREKVKPFPPIEEDPLWELVGTASFEPIEDVDAWLASEPLALDKPDPKRGHS